MLILQTGLLEGAHFMKTGKLVSLSEQNFLDCDRKDLACRGGMFDTALDFAIKEGGIDTEESYPYVGYDVRLILIESNNIHFN